MSQRTKKTISERKTSAPRTGGNASWINVALPPGAGEDIEKHYPDEMTTAGWLLALIGQSENVFVKRQDDGESVCCGLIQRHPDDPTKLMAVSGWADNPYDAVRALLYKWYVVMGEFWPEPTQNDARRFR